MHQSAVLIIRGEHYVIYVLYTARRLKLSQYVVIITSCPAIKFGLPPYLHIMH